MLALNLQGLKGHYLALIFIFIIIKAKHILVPICLYYYCTSLYSDQPASATVQLQSTQNAAARAPNKT